MVRSITTPSARDVVRLLVASGIIVTVRDSLPLSSVRVPTMVSNGAISLRLPFPSASSIVMQPAAHITMQHAAKSAM